ncbi:hypothetical protein [Nitrosovibrio tenuis]|uniref:Uncharacterized protein n=1 Tax=Nitrosovibrio tenuis TaxID=1233 RepID=A0A1H7R254_9PROT|nr:hypothetical protein [Nitrosovibrio tenuis]SEL54306.1 hypothetical protein SAMN05216387_11454 [Nitrosovibrio tenuis]
MTTYVLYTRTEAGIIERNDYAVFHYYGPLGPDAHEQPLVGWPELKVFWAKKIGASIGMAPYEAQTSPKIARRTRQRKNKKPALQRPQSEHF